jgi:hypothetical protein
MWLLLLVQPRNPIAVSIIYFVTSRKPKSIAKVKKKIVDQIPANTDISKHCDTGP